MNFILVPFLLGLQVSDKGNWQYGPEYTFSARTSMLLDLEENMGNYTGTTLVNKMKCRPKEPDTLICRFEDSKITRLSPQGLDLEETIPPPDAVYKPFGFGNASFEIKFNEKGIESYSFEDDDRKSPDFLVNFYRTIANQLSLGVKIKDTQCDDTESFTIGECFVTCRVTREKPENGTTGKNFEISPLSNLNITEEDVLSIVRTRDPWLCNPRPMYFFGTRYTYGLVHRGTIEKLRISASRMLISKSSFTTEAVFGLQLFDKDGNRLGDAIDHIHLALESIEPARSELQSISNPKKRDILVKSLDNFL